MLRSYIHNYPVLRVFLLVVVFGSIVGTSATAAITYVGTKDRLLTQIKSDTQVLAKEVLGKVAAQVDSETEKAKSVFEKTYISASGTPAERRAIALQTLQDGNSDLFSGALTRLQLQESGQLLSPFEDVYQRDEDKEIILPFSVSLDIQQGTKLYLRGEILLGSITNVLGATSLADTSSGGSLLTSRNYTLLSKQGNILYSTKRYPLFSDYETKSFATIASERQQGRYVGIYLISDTQFNAYTSIKPDGSVSGEQFVLIIEQNVSGIVSAIKTNVFANVVIMVIVGILMAVMIAFLMRELMMRPIHDLITAAGKIEKGGFNVKLQPRGRNELAHLTKSFMQMAASQESTINRISRLNTELTFVSKILRHDITNRLVYLVYSTKQLLADKELDKTTLQTLKEMETVTNSTLTFIEDSKKMLDEGNGVELIPFSVKDVLEEVAKLEPGVDIRIQGDGVIRVDQAVYSLFNNIIHNAVVHGGVKRVDIAVAKDSKYITVKIADQGKGISDAVKQRLFHEGYIHGSTGHTGIGLYAAKQIIERYHGAISVEDNLPRGVVFVIQFPVPVKKA